MPKGTNKAPRGIGLYTYEQSKNTSPFDYFATVVVGGIVAALGGILVFDRISVRRAEILDRGTSEAHVWGWIVSLGITVIGMFMAHAGLIFYFRRLISALRDVDGERRSKKRGLHNKR